MQIFQVERLPEVDQRELKRGKCPWCLTPLVPGGLVDKDAGDVCPDCGDEFVGSLTIED